MSKYRVSLTSDQQQGLESLCRKGLHNARTIKRARVLLLVDEGHTYKQISALERVGRTTAHDIAKRFHQRGLEGTLYDAPRPGQARVFDDGDEAQLIAIACSDPPDGRECWTIAMMRDAAVARTGKEASNSTIARILKAHDLKPWREKNVVCR